VIIDQISTNVTMTVTTLAQAVERHLDLDNGDCVHRRCRRGFRRTGNAHLPAISEVIE
jgi:hypothetical protein